jgi:hypothetical protein
MVTQPEERVALTATHLFEVENVLVKGHRLVNVIHFDRNMIASINLHAHMRAYLKKHTARSVFFVVTGALHISAGLARTSCHCERSEESQTFGFQASTQG